MTLKVYNTLTRKKEAFKPIRKNVIHMYTCGPTVYALPHIGNYRSFFMADNIRRYLEYKGYKVKHVMNITDIDDKTIRDSEKEGMKLKEFTRKYEKVFLEGLDTLNIKRAWKYPRATENFDEMKKIVRGLIKKKYAYVKSHSVYYDISKFKNYGKLSKVDLSNIKIGATVDMDEYDKDSPQDFALMKRSTLNELKRGIFYKTEWGNVRPGWHIECSALSMKYLGKTFDIHTGGTDLIFPHHENEIAQSEAYTGNRFVNYWLHGEHLIVNGEKMSKSKGNYFTLDDIVKKFGPEVVRFMFVSAHYRKKLNYTDEFGENTRNNYNKLKDTLLRLEDALKKAKSGKADIKKITKIKEKFIKAMDDDFNNPVALSAVYELAKEINRYLANEGNNEKVLKGFYKTFKEFSSVFGLFEKKIKKKRIPKGIIELAEKREIARKKKDWKTSDKIRSELKKKGYIIEDTEKGYKVKDVSHG